MAYVRGYNEGKLVAQKHAEKGILPDETQKDRFRSALEHAVFESYYDGQKLTRQQIQVGVDFNQGWLDVVFEKDH